MTDFIPLTYMGTTLFWLVLFATAFFFTLLPLLLLITNIARSFTGMLKSLGLYD